MVKSILPMSYFNLEDVLSEGLKNKEKAQKSVENVVGLFTAIQETVRTQVADFINQVSTA